MRAPVICLAVSLACPTLTQAEGANDFTCRTKLHTVIVKQVAENQYTYQSWSSKKSLDSAPDLSLKGGTYDIAGTGACASRSWTFHAGNYQYTVSRDLACGPEAPPANAIGDLSVILNDPRKGADLKGHWYCMK